MEVNWGQSGIQLLLAAEQEAQRIVAAAREAKMASLRQAKEVAEFLAQMEREFPRKVAESSGNSGANLKRLDQETESKVEQLKIEGSRISHDVVQMLLTTVKNQDGRLNLGEDSFDVPRCYCIMVLLLPFWRLSHNRVPFINVD